MQPDKPTFRLGGPAHGWLPVSLAVADFKLEFTASAVPADPLAGLASALALVTQRAAAAVMWYLEPQAYRFQFSPEADGSVRLVIVEAGPGTADRPLLNLNGSYEAVVMPFWRALRKLSPADFGGTAWPALPTEKLARLRSLVQARRYS